MDFGTYLQVINYSIACELRGKLIVGLFNFLSYIYRLLRME